MSSIDENLIDQFKYSIAASLTVDQLYFQARLYIKITQINRY